MIPALFEGVTQSILPCSWILLLPAIALGLATQKATVFAVFAPALVFAAWMAAAGWLVPALWFAGSSLVGGAVLWWRGGATVVPAALVGIGSAWAWRPCVGPELGNALTTAQTDPLAAFGGLAAFLVGVIAVGIVLGVGGSMLINKRHALLGERAGAVIVGLLGFAMILGLYPGIASIFARWSTQLWA